jgi:hypothetical protein
MLLHAAACLCTSSLLPASPPVCMPMDGAPSLNPTSPGIMLAPLPHLNARRSSMSASCLSLAASTAALASTTYGSSMRPVVA